MLYSIIMIRISGGHSLKTHTTIGKFIFGIGLLLSLSGLETSFGPFHFNSFIQNKSVALIFILVGVTFLITSSFFKKH